MTKIRKEQANNELLLEQISAGISVGSSKKIYQTLNLRLKAIVRDVDLNADSFLDYIYVLLHKPVNMCESYRYYIRAIVISRRFFQILEMSAKCLVDQMSCRPNVLSVKCPVGKTSVGQMSVGKTSVGQMSVGQMSVG